MTPYRVGLRDDAHCGRGVMSPHSAPDEEGGDPGRDAGRHLVAVDRSLQPGGVGGVVLISDWSAGS
jgi:hypothetical protein